MSISRRARGRTLGGGIVSGGGGTGAGGSGGGVVVVVARQIVVTTTPKPANVALSAAPGAGQHPGQSGMTEWLN